MKKTVLLVDDEPQFRVWTRIVLELEGYRVLTAADGAEGLRVCEEHEEPAEPIDVLITDVQMPRMGGPELARYAVSLRPELRVLFVSGDLGGAVLPRVRGKEPPFLAKPFTMNALSEKLREVLTGPPPRFDSEFDQRHPDPDEALAAPAVVPAEH